MRILYFGDAVQFHLRRWAHFFADQGFECHVLTFNPEILADYDPVKVHLVGERFREGKGLTRLVKAPFMLSETRSLVANLKPDIVHAFSSTGYAWCAAACGARPLIVSPTGSDVLIQAAESRLTHFMTKFALSRSAVVHTDSDNVKAVLPDLGVPDANIVKIRYGTDMDKFTPGEGDGQFRVKHRLTRSNLVVSTRRLDPVHDVSTFIRAIPLVLERFADVEFLIVGWGEEHDALVELAQTLEVSQAVRFLGRVEEHEMISALRLADVYASCSLSESGIAASTAEAMACGLPIVTTDVGDMKQWITEGEHGFFFEQKDHRTLAERLVHLLENPVEREGLGNKNRALIFEGCNYQTEMGKFADLYRSLKKGNA